MPRIKYVCDQKECGNEFYLFYALSGKVANSAGCPKCGLTAKRQLSAPASKSVFMVDNGAQARAVELDLNVIESNKETSKKAYNRGD